MWHLGTWLSSGLGSAGSRVGFKDLRHLFQPKWFYGSFLEAEILQVVVLYHCQWCRSIQDVHRTSPAVCVTANVPRGTNTDLLLFLVLGEDSRFLGPKSSSKVLWYFREQESAPHSTLSLLGEDTAPCEMINKLSWFGLSTLSTGGCGRGKYHPSDHT